LRTDAQTPILNIALQFSREVDAMAGVKQQAIEVIEHSPDDVTTDDIRAELYFKAQVDAGLSQLAKGVVLAHKDVEQRMSKCLAQ
jgi:hypothetical protein